MYPVNKIIFCESFYVEHFVSKHGTIESFNLYLQKRTADINPWLEKLERLLLYYLHGCHIICFPPNILADELHHLYLSPIHYCKNYYRYAYENIRQIAYGTSFSAMDMIGIDNGEICRLLKRTKHED